MSLRAAFPQTAALLPNVPFWEAPFSWSNPDVRLLTLLWLAQRTRLQHMPAFWVWTEAMIADLRQAHAAIGSAEARNAIDGARFITCAPALDMTRASGQLCACWDWIWTALSATHVPSQQINQNTYQFPVPLEKSSPLAVLFTKHVSHFTAACYYVAYKFGGLDELSGDLAPACLRLASLRLQQDPNDDVAFEALQQMVIWAAYRDWADGETAAHDLLAAAGRTISTRLKLQSLITFTTPAHRFVDRPPQEWAAQALAEHAEDMVGHERLQMLAMVVRDLADWHMRRREILAEIAALRDECFAFAQPGQSPIEKLEQLVSITHPLLFHLVNCGATDAVFDLLSAWYRATDAEPADRDILAVFPTHNGGTAYLWPGGSWITGTMAETGNAMMRAIKPALGIYMRDGDGDHAPESFEEFRPDMPQAPLGYALEAAMEAHYRFRELHERLPDEWRPRATLFFGGGPEPIQAMLAKAARVVAPLEISFQRARPPRPVRRIAVWIPGGLFHATFELEAIQHVAGRAGWIIDVHQPDHGTAEDLRRFYEAEDADVAWVISHGAHDWHAIVGTGLHLPDGGLVDLEQIVQWRVPGPDRRLLILNSCSGAAAQLRGGIPRIGLASSLVSGRQAVVGHMWPVSMATGLAFGATLAGCLEDHGPEAAALAAVALMHDPGHMLAFLDGKFAGCELLERLHRSDEDFGSLTNWGCPVVLT